MGSFRKLVLAGIFKTGPAVDWSYDRSEYDVLTDVGAGGCSNVVLAMCKKNQRLCAIKQISMTGPGAIDRSLSEIRLMGKLKHPNIIRLNAAFAFVDHFWIVEDFFPFGSLEDVMRRGSRKTHEVWSFDECAIATIMKDVLSALDFLHKHGYIHNDIKPGNIFLKQDGNSILADLGGAKYCRDKSPGMVSTAWFRAPEVNRKTGFSFKSDVWATGITALVLHGQQGFMTMTYIERIRAAIEMNFEGLSRPFRSFVSKTLHLVPKDRASITVLLQTDFLFLGCDKQTIADTAAEHFDMARRAETFLG